VVWGMGRIQDIRDLGDELHYLIEAIYDEVWQDRPWVRCLARLRQMIPCHTMAIEARDAGISMATYYFAAGRRVEASDIGVWEERGADQAEEILLEDGEVRVWDDWRSETVSLGFLRLLEKYDVLRSMSMGIVEIDGVHYSLHSGRSILAAPYSAIEQQVFHRIAGHLARAIRLRLHLSLTRTSEALQADAMERLSVGALMVDCQATILYANTTAERILAEGDGLLRRHGRLRASHATATQALQTMLEELRGGPREPVRALSIPRLPGVRDLYLVLKHHRIRDRISDRPREVILIYIHDPEVSYAENTTVYQQLFRFTPAEATIAASLAAGLAVEVIEEELDISHNTMRAHLRSMFAKTDVGSRAELIHLLVNSPAPLAGG